FMSAINRLPADATEHLPRRKDGSINAYALGIAAQRAHRFSTNELIKAMQACLDANLQLVTTQLDHELILTEVVVKLLGEVYLSPTCLRAIGPMYGISQRAPVNAFTVAMIQRTTKAMLMIATIIPQKKSKRPAITGIDLKIRATMDAAIEKRSQAPPRMIDCIE